MSSTGAKGSQQTNTSQKKGFKQREQKTTEVCPGLAHRTVRCTRESNSELATFGNSRSRSAIIHRTVRCCTGLSGVPASNGYFAPTVVCEGIKYATVRACAQKSEQAPEGAPDSLQDLSGAPPDCPMAPQVRAPTVEP
jgi:hypothetical protein